MKNIFKILGVLMLMILNVACEGSETDKKTGGIISMSAEEAANTVLKDESIIVIDIRTADEFNTGHVKGALNIDFYGSDFKDKLNLLDKEQKYAVYCRSGNRSGKAMPIFEELGFKEIYHINNGVIGLNGINYPLVTE